MRVTHLSVTMLFTLTLFALDSPDLPTAVQAQEAARPADAAAFRPKWKVGDAWMIETQSRQVQTRETDAARPGAKLQWKFTVQTIEKLGGRDCFRLGVKCLSQQRPQPNVTVWIDTTALALRQIQTQVQVSGDMRTLTESYQFAGEQPTPVLSPLTALPIDLPLFLAGETKGTQTFQYESIPGPAGTKNVGDVGFVFQIEQGMTPADAEKAKGLLNEDFAKSLTTQPVVEVRLKTIDRQVKQLWRTELPWPAYSDNGTTVARLIKVLPTANTDKP
jgi:hypothetical protein